MNRRIAALTIADLAMSGLTACTATPETSPSASMSTSSADGGQSVADACALVQDTIEQASADFQNAAKDDPTAVVDAMKAAGEKLAAAADEVTNSEVAAVLPGLQDMFAQTADIMQAIIDGDVSKIDDLAKLGDTFHDTVQQFQDVCSA